MLTKVTITGADDATDPNALASLSKEFPFVEWGILFSVKRQGSARYPSIAWVNRFREIAYTSSLKTAAHFCGANARDTINGNDFWVPDAFGFQRIQLNGWDGQGLAKIAFKIRELHPKRPDVELIMQTRNEAMLDVAAEVASEIAPLGRASALFDPSGGRGIESASWPQPPKGLSIGFAGGIKPSNVEAVLRNIGGRDHDFWIDMESGVRTDDKFDLGLVRQMLALTAPHVAKE